MKAQVTLFIIIGLVMVIAVGITLYATSFIMTKTRVVKPDVKGFVDDCLKSSAEYAFQDIALSGGFLKDDVRKVFNYENQNFSVLISRPSHDICKENVCLYYASPPSYPWLTFPFFDDTKSKETFVGYFGDSDLPTLDVMRERLEQDIKERLIICADFSYLENLGLSVSELSPPKINISFYNLSYLSEQGISQDRFSTVKLDWSLVESSDASVVLADHFSVKLPVRFSTIYYSVESLINKDISNISYSPKIEGMNVSVVDAGDHSIINVVDHLSNLFGESFTFSFARENRFPALWFFDLPTKTFHVTAEGNPTKVIIENDKLIFDDPCEGVFSVLLNASDADENDVVFDVFPKNLGLSDKSLRITASDGYLEDFNDFEVSVSLCVPE